MGTLCQAQTIDKGLKAQAMVFKIYADLYIQNNSKTKSAAIRQNLTYLNEAQAFFDNRPHRANQAILGISVAIREVKTLLKSAEGGSRNATIAQRDMAALEICLSKLQTPQNPN